MNMHLPAPGLMEGRTFRSGRTPDLKVRGSIYN